MNKAILIKRAERCDKNADEALSRAAHALANGRNWQAWSRYYETCRRHGDHFRWRAAGGGR